MRLGPLAVLVFTLVGSSTGLARPQQLSSQPSSQSTPGTISVPPGTKVAVALTSPVWSKAAKPGDSVYAVSVFPVAIAQQMAIPTGTYVQGLIDVVKRPSWTSNRAEFQMHFTKLIYGNGYTVDLTQVAGKPDGSSAAVADFSVEVSARSDILLDNGSQIQVEVRSPLSLDAERVADAARRSRPVATGAFKTASRCIPIPPTPGTDPTVIPGTPATPPTVIPQGPGLPDVVIPGSPGTSPTVIGGSSGSPGVACPGPPVVLPSMGPARGNTGGSTSKIVVLEHPIRLAGKTLSAGTYRASWNDQERSVEVSFWRGKTLVMRAEARLVWENRPADKDQIQEQRDADGSFSLESLKFEGDNFTLVFEEKKN
jgi:hypothetical protein